MWGAWYAFRAGRGAWRGYQSFRARDRAAHAKEGIDNGPWTIGALTFMLAPMALIGAGVATAQGSQWAWAWWLATAALVAVTAAGTLLRNRKGGKVLEHYEHVPRRDRAQVLREHAALLREVEEQREAVEARTQPLPQAAVTQPMPAVRDDLTERLFAQPCPEPECLAQPPVACLMGIGIPVSLVSVSPVEFCHVARMQAGVAAGTVTAEEVSARHRMTASS